MKKLLLRLVERLQEMFRLTDLGADEIDRDFPRRWSRAPARDRDRILLSQTHIWLRLIPSALLPKHVCRHHPHVANRFAESWGDMERIQQLVDDLLIDRRGGRKGFSQRVRIEIEELERFHARSLSDPAGVRKSLAARQRRAHPRTPRKSSNDSRDRGDGHAMHRPDASSQASSFSISGV